jgi:ribosome-binding ATPase YchF (GTP1/OBG family)
MQAALEDGKPLRALELTGDDRKRLRGFQFLSAKPLLLVINLDEDDLAEVGSTIEKAADKSA